MLDRSAFEARLAVASVEVLDVPNRGTLYFADGDLFIGPLGRRVVRGRCGDPTWSCSGKRCRRVASYTSRTWTRPAITLTLRLAALTTAILLLVATPVAYWISLGSGPLRRIVQALVALPLVLPPTVLGLYLLVGLGPLTGAWGSVDRRSRPLRWPSTFSGLVLGSLVFSLPFAVAAARRRLRWRRPEPDRHRARAGGFAVGSVSTSPRCPWRSQHFLPARC